MASLNRTRGGNTSSQQDKNLSGLTGAVARSYATAPRYAVLAEQIATQPNLIEAITPTEADVARATATASRTTDSPNYDW